MSVVPPKSVPSLAALSTTINVPVVSFDLFDTLIKRKHLAVNEIHDTVSAYLLARLGRSASTTPGKLTLTRYNITSFLKTSPHTRMEEPSLRDVWAHALSAHGGRSPDDPTIIDDAIDFEFELELQNLDLVTGARDVLRRMQADGKRLIAISDMYFTHAQIEAVLEKLGILSFFEKVYVSSNIGLTKQTGRLFSHVLEDLCLSPVDLHHVGDNPHSDVAMGREIGLSVTQIDQHELLHIQRPAYGRRTDIHDEMADLVKLFLFKVLLRSIKNETKQIYFASRDGLLIHEVLKRWSSPLVGRYLDRSPKADLFLSRAMSCWLALNFQGDWLTQAVGFAFWLCQGSATPRQISDLFGLDEVPSSLDDVLYSSARDTVVVVGAYQAAGLEERVRASILEKRRAAEAYLRDVGFFSIDHATLCDVGYSGTVARDLNSYFIQESLRAEAIKPPKVELELLSTNGNYEQNAILGQPYIHFNDGIILPAAHLPASLTDSFAWLEVFFKHPTFGPLRGYRPRAGRMEPDYEVAPRQVSKHPTDAILKASIAKPEDIILLWMASTQFWGQFIDPLIARFAAPDMETVSQMQADIYEEDAVSGRKRSVVLVRPDLSAAEIYRLAKRKDYWIPASILASAQHRTGAPEAPSVGSAPLEPVADPLQQRTPAVGALKNVLRASRLHRSVRSHLRLSGLGAGRVKIDHAFYRTYYADLGSLDDAALERHYAEHGRQEGRVATPDALVVKLEQDAGPLPSNFDPHIYKAINPDLTLEHDWELKAHYLGFGRREGRRYSGGFGLVDQEFEDLARDGHIQLSRQERQAWKAGVPARQLIFRRAAIDPGPWLLLLHFGEFAALNSAWAGPLRSRAHAIAVLLDRGIARLPPLSLRAQFDPVYYAKRHPELGGVDPERVYRHWLRYGAGQGEAACEADRLFQLVGEHVFPAAFRRDLFAERLPAAERDRERPDPVELLAKFLDGPYTAYADLAEGPSAARLWEAVAGRARDRGRLDDAERAFENALEHDGPPGRIWHQLGDLAERQHRLHDALACYERAAATAAPDRWSYVNGIRIAAGLGYFPQGLALVRAGAAIWAEKEPWRRARDHLYDAWFDDALRTCRDGDDALMGIVAELTRLIEDELPLGLRFSDPDGPVLVLSRHEQMPHVAIMRVESALAAEFGRDARLFTASQVSAFTQALPTAGMAVFHEVRPRPATLRAVRTARAIGVPTRYWGGPLDGADSPPFRDKDASQNLSALLASPLACHFMAQCDQGIATLPAAAAVLERETLGKTAQLVGRLAQAAPRPPQRSDAVTFVIRLPADAPAELLARSWAAVETLLSERETVSIVFDDATTPPRSLARFGHRLSGVRLRATDAQAVWLLQDADAFIAFGPDAGASSGEPPLGPPEAAVWGVPVLVIGQVSERGAAGLAGVSWKEAVSALLRLADRKPHPDDGGWHARAASIGRFLTPPAPARERQSDRAQRPRILCANVFFPPQTIGGATRVLKDNVDFLLDNHADDFDLAVLTSDDENDRTGAKRIDAYRGVPVLRIATPQEIDMDWRPYNAEVYRDALRALDTFRPDLVHIHCLQRLSVAVAEACRMRDIPYVVTLHDAWWLSDFSFLIDEDGQLAMPSRNLLTQPRSNRIGLTESVARGMRLREALGGAAARLAVSRPFAEIYRSCGLQVDVVANGVSRLTRPQRTPAGPRVRLAHLGGTQHHKGAYLIEAALRQNAFQNLSLTIVDLFRDHGDVSHTTWGTTPVTIVGKIPSSLIEGTYARSDVVVAPSIWPESFGLVSREALSAGCWVVASRLGAMGEEVIEGENGFLVDVQRPDDIVRILRMIDSDPDTYKRSPPRRPELRLVDDQSRELIGIYRRMLGE